MSIYRQFQYINNPDALKLTFAISPELLSENFGAFNLENHQRFSIISTQQDFVARRTDTGTRACFMTGPYSLLAQGTTYGKWMANHFESTHNKVDPFIYSTATDSSSLLFRIF